MSRFIDALLDRAEREFCRDHVVSSDTQAALAEEGYELDRLDAEMERRMSTLI